MSLVPFSRNGNALATQANSVFDAIEHHWSNLLDNFFSPTSIGDLKNKVKNGGYPRLDVFTTKYSYVIEAAVPGVKPEDLSVEVYEEDTQDLRNSGGKTRCVRISGQVDEVYRYEDANWAKKELCRRAFSRTVTLPDHVHGDPTATVVDGMMTLVWSLKPEEKTPEVRKIEIKKR